MLSNTAKYYVDNSDAYKIRSEPDFTSDPTNWNSPHSNNCIFLLKMQTIEYVFVYDLNTINVAKYLIKI